MRCRHEDAVPTHGDVLPGHGVQPQAWAQVSVLAPLLKQVSALGLLLTLSVSHWELESNWGKVTYIEFLTH